MKRENLQYYFERAVIILFPVVPILLAFVVGGLIILSQGRNPFEAYAALFRGAFGDVDSIGTTIARAIPLTFTGLAVAIAYKGGVFNIGAEGQLLLGGICATAVGTSLPNLPGWLLIPLSIGAAALGGAAWAFLPGYLKAKRGLNEVLTTLMMNYIAVQFISYMVRGPLQGHPDGHPTSAVINEAARLPVIWPQARLPLSALIAPLCALLIFVLMFKTTLGFSLRAVGANDQGARYAGIQVPRTIITTMLISGALAGMAGGVEILGIQHRLWETFLIGYGYDGIAVALVGQLHPFGVLLTALFFGALGSGANAMQVLVRVPVPLVDIIKSLTILFAVAGTAIRIRPRRRADSDSHPAEPALPPASGDVVLAGE